jgi:hypothetical protein
MKLFHKFSKYIILPLFVFVLGGCLTDFEGVNVDPNNPADASVDLLIPQIEYTLAANLAGGVNDAQLGFASLLSSFDNFGVANTSFSGFWDNMYAGPLKDIEGLIVKAEADGLPHHMAVGQLLKAYAFSTMVNLFGDVPYSEAFKGEDIASRAPTFDADEVVFNDCIDLVDKALANFALTSGAKVTSDLIYGGDVTKWKAFANTLKLKLTIESWRANPVTAKAEITKLLAEPLITTAAGDFQFRFSKTINPDNRHPWYQGSAYGGNDFTYISHQLMVEMLEDGDPRWPFYFRRQNKKVLDVNNPTDAGTIPCWTTPGCNYGYVVLNTELMNDLFGPDITQEEVDFAAGIFGRDRSDASGVPNDGALRTIPGVYPCGGYYDGGAPATPSVDKAPGGGIFPALTHVNVLYYQIEAILEDQLALPGDARVLFESAIRSHISKVAGFGASTDPASVAPAAASVDAFVAKWLERFDNAPSNRARLNVVMKQLWFSSWGNGYEIYNAMRRTHDPNASNNYGYNGLPNTLQNPVSQTPRKWPNRLPYPSTELTLNSSAAPWKDIIWDDPSSRLFWDTE